MSWPEPDSVTRNVQSWTEANAEYTDGRAAQAWARDGVTWGLWGIPEAQVGALGDVAGLDVVELGCGTGLGIHIKAHLAACDLAGCHGLTDRLGPLDEHGANACERFA